jgi:hypothetical protein
MDGWIFEWQTDKQVESAAPSLSVIKSELPVKQRFLV